MEKQLLIGLSSVLVLGILGQWLAWRLRLPSILLLLIFGFIAGPITGVLYPDKAFGEMLFPIVSLSVAIILFEGGLSLRLSELKQGGRAIRNLVTVGILVTWVLGALAAWAVVGLSLQMSLLAGGILVVSGPTVIIPLLRQVRPLGRLASIAKWEGIVNDPIGALLAVLIFQVILIGGQDGSTSMVVISALKAFVLGSLIGLAAAGVMVLLLRRYYIPDFLQNPVSVMLVVLSFVAANVVQAESGLLAVTVMGVALANQRFVSIRHILEFKENLRVLLISSLFIILAARIPLNEVLSAHPLNWLFVVILILVVRPAAVFASSLGTNLKMNEKLFLSWMAPRGIVAAAVVSVFALHLMDEGVPGANMIVSLVFQVIIGTVTVYGLSASWVALKLKVAQPSPQGALIAGAQGWVRELAVILKEEGLAVVLVDTNWHNITEARKAGLGAHYANILTEDLSYTVPLDGIGRLMALTPNDEVNALATLHFVDLFGRSEVYQLSPMSSGSASTQAELPKHLRGRFLFGEKATYENLSERFAKGALVKRSKITDEFTYESFQEAYGETALPLATISATGVLDICTAQERVRPKAGDMLISLVDGDRVSANGQGKVIR